MRSKHTTGNFPIDPALQNDTSIEQMIEAEERNYQVALAADKEFNVLKEIREKIKQLKSLAVNGAGSSFQQNSKNS